MNVQTTWIKTKQQKPPFVKVYESYNDSTIQESDYVLAKIGAVPVVGFFETVSWPSGEYKNRFKTQDGYYYETVSHWSPITMPID